MENPTPKPPAPNLIPLGPMKKIPLVGVAHCEVSPAKKPDKK